MRIHLKMKMDVMLIGLLISSILSLERVNAISLSQQPILTLKDHIGQLYDCIDFYKQPAFNNPSLKNYISKDHIGQLYDCIDFYKQPAFNHPSLKNHISQVRPPLVQQVERKPKGIGFKHGGCPIGSVPILRVNNFTSQQLHPPPSQKAVSQPPCFAVIQTKLEDSNRKFYGSNAAISLHKPAAQQFQLSAARIKLSHGQDSIEAGWMVNPTAFKDNEAHLYAKFKAGEKGCINVYCTGFVQVSKEVALGLTPETYSTIGKGPKFTWNIFVEKHSEDGHWWVILAGPNNKRYPIGYWPKTLFTNLAEVANQVEWGGETYNPLLLHPPPDMGSGKEAMYDTKFSAFFQHVTVNTDISEYVEPQGTIKVYTCPQWYTVLDDSYQGDYWGRLMFYGGGIHPGLS